MLITCFQIVISINIYICEIPLSPGTNVVAWGTAAYGLCNKPEKSDSVQKETQIDPHLQGSSLATVLRDWIAWGRESLACMTRVLKFAGQYLRQKNLKIYHTNIQSSEYYRHIPFTLPCVLFCRQDVIDRASDD